jgi:hypothetical protein
MYEDPTFSNLAEVDAQPSASAAITGGASNIGSAIILGSLSSTLGGSETSIQKHVSVTGNELIQQISTPITLKNLYRLGNSNAPEIPLLRMSVNRLGNLYNAYDRIIELIYLLDLYGAIVIEARNENTWTITLHKNGIVTRQQVGGDEELKCFAQSSEAVVSALWDELPALLGFTGKSTIVLRSPEAKTVADPSKKSELVLAQETVTVPVMLTRSALGAIGRAEGQGSHDIKFVSPEDAVSIRNANNVACRIPDYYLLPKGQDLSSPSRDWKAMHTIALTDSDRSAALYDARGRGNRAALILVEESEYRPATAFVSVSQNGKWYSINQQDAISKMNFALLNTILTIQAIPSSTSPTATTISAGAAAR